MHRIAHGILVVDDDQLNRGTTSRVLRTACKGVKVYEAESGEEALKLLSSQKKIEVVVSDVQMPQMDGVQLSIHVDNNHPETHIILMSGEKEPVDHKAHGFVQKPFDMGGLIRVIQAVLDQRLGKK